MSDPLKDYLDLCRKAFEEAEARSRQLSEQDKALHRAIDAIRRPNDGKRMGHTQYTGPVS